MIDDKSDSQPPTDNGSEYHHLYQYYMDVEVTPSPKNGQKISDARRLRTRMTSIYRCSSD